MALAIAKGAPEAIVALCRSDEQQNTAALVATAQMEGAGLRVLAVARASRARAGPKTRVLSTLSYWA